MTLLIKFFQELFFVLYRNVSIFKKMYMYFHVLRTRELLPVEWFYVGAVSIF